MINRIARGRLGIVEVHGQDVMQNGLGSVEKHISKHMSKTFQNDVKHISK